MDKNRDDHEAEIVDLAENPEAEEEAMEQAEQRMQGDQNAGAAAQAQADLLNKLVRLQADFDNYRRRTASGRSEAREEARREMLLDLLPIYDNFLRAMDHAEETEDYGSLRTGIQGILQQMRDFFVRQNLQEIDSKPGTEFNPNYHDALGTMAGNVDAHNTIAQEILKGFQLNGAVIRPAQVLVFNGE